MDIPGNPNHPPRAGPSGCLQRSGVSEIDLLALRLERLKYSLFLFPSPNGYSSSLTALEQAIHRNPKHAKRSLVFETLCGLVEFLKRQLGIFVEFLIVD